ncbi:hypothetical protein CsSME_00047848 [Camellia sinensis var. sinensis]
MNDDFEFLNPKNPCSLLLFILSNIPLPLRTRSTNHHPPISSNLVETNSFSATIVSQTGPLPFIISSNLKSDPTSNSPHSTSNCSANTFQRCFHLNTSPLLQLKASFFAYGSTAAHIWCSAIKSASDASEYPSHASRVPGNFIGTPSCLHIEAYTHKVPTIFIRLYGENPNITPGLCTDHVKPSFFFTSSYSMSSRVW